MICIFIKKNSIMKIFIYLTALFLFTSVFAQDNFWVNKTKTNISQDDIINYTSQVSKYSVFELDEAQLIICPARCTRSF